MTGNERRSIAATMQVLAAVRDPVCPLAGVTVDFLLGDDAIDRHAGLSADDIAHCRSAGVRAVGTMRYPQPRSRAQRGR